MLLSLLTLLVFTVIDGLFKPLNIIRVQILREGIVGIREVSGEGWGTFMLLPGITDHYIASFLAWAFTMDVQYIVFGVDPKNL